MGAGMSLVLVAKANLHKEGLGEVAVLLGMGLITPPASSSHTVLLGMGLTTPPAASSYTVLLGMGLTTPPAASSHVDGTGGIYPPD